MLGGAQERLHRVVQRCVRRQCHQVRDHRFGYRQVQRKVLHLRHRGFLLCAQENEEGNEDEHGVGEQSDEAKHKCQRLADPGGDLGGAAVRQGHGQQRAQYAAAVHWKGGNEVEEHQ